MNKRNVVNLIEGWLIEKEAYQIKPVHPLVAVQEGHLGEGGHRGGARETRPAGRSKPPIRDMRGVNNKVDRVMSVVREVDKTWYNALIWYVELGSLDNVTAKSGWSKPTVKTRFDCGIACFRGAWES